VIFDPLTLTSIVLFVALALITIASMPKQDREQGQLASVVCITAGTILAYASASLPLFALGWAITAVPYWVWIKNGPKLALAGGTLVLIAGAALQTGSSPSMRTAAFGLLMLAAVARKGLFPLHSWVVNGLDQSPILPLGLLLNGHLGAFLVIRFAIPLFPEIASGPGLMFASIPALFTALYASVLALSEKRPRRILGLLSVSQASFILAGLENRNVEGVTGALVHWFVVAVATTGLYCVYRAIEARYPGVASQSGFLGLSNTAPRLAALFAVCGLALIGLPGTLGFAAEDLLFHGSLESHPLLGITLPLATALNAITTYRLFANLFLGRGPSATPVITDALPRERWALTAAVTFLVMSGIVPGLLVSLRSPAGEHLAAMLGAR
jgi:NADH-quinone oxidoreductase subunit M